MGEQFLIIKPIDETRINALFAQLEKYDQRERAQTYDCLRRALDQTRRSVGAVSAFTSEVS